MKGKRTDLETKWKIIVSLMKWEQWSDIAKEVWVHESTVSRIKDNDLQEVARDSKIISEIIEIDMQSIKNMAEITKRFTEQIKRKEELDKSDISVANTSVDSAFKRSQIYQDKATDNVWFVDWASILRDIQSWKLGTESAYDLLRKIKE